MLIVHWNSTDFSEEHVGSIYRAEGWAKQETKALYLLHYGFLFALTIQPWKWRWYVPLKYRLTFNRLHGGISHKIELSRDTAVRTSKRKTPEVVGVLKFRARDTKANDAAIYWGVWSALFEQPHSLGKEPSATQGRGAVWASQKF
jgi:hypothetical protein